MSKRFQARPSEPTESIWPALFVLLLCFVALVAWLFVAWAAQP